jgi:hypothetical protein
MASDFKLRLLEEQIKTEAIVLQAEGYNSVRPENFERYEREQDDSGLMIGVHSDTGEPLVVVLETFKDDTEYVVQKLREYPLPWTFTVPQMGIKEKPLEDILLAVWKKYRDRV